MDETGKEIVVAIIGGSGADSVFGKENIRAALEGMGLKVSRVYTTRPETILGLPEGELVVAELDGGGKVIFMARHGRGHRNPPSALNWGGNIGALKSLGVTHILALSACGSLSRWIPPGTITLMTQHLDFAGIDRPFSDDGPAVHVSMADPTCGHLNETVVRAARKTGINIRCTAWPLENLWSKAVNLSTLGQWANLCCLCINGPAFSTRAASKAWRKLDAHLVGMSLAKESEWARVAGIHYVCLGLVCDFDAWYRQVVTVEMVEAALPDMVKKAVKIYLHTIGMIFSQELQWDCGYQDALKGALQTSVEDLTVEQRKLLEFFGWRSSVQ